MFWLRLQGIWGLIGEFDPQQGVLSTHSDDELPSLSPRGFDGWYSDMDDGVFALYRSGNALYFWACGDIFPLDDETVVEVSGPRRKRLLRVVRRGRVVFETTYAVPLPGSIPGDYITQMVKDEDSDFGLFVSDISRNSSRKAAAMEVWGVEGQEQNAA